MPQMANVVVKKADGTTDVTYTALTASAGDSSPARWTENSASTIRGHRPTLDVRSQFNGPRTARRVSAVFKMPVLETISGVETKVGDIPVELSLAIPSSVTDAVADEAVAQATNLFASSLIRSSLSSGYAPT